jgi:DNA-binding transcriptional regulator LsrR (DeoR family)/DNA-binding XRE family transcriptional regulator
MARDREAPAYLKQLGARLRELRRKQRLSQERVAEELNVAAGTYATWERGLFAPRLEQLIALAERYEISIDDLLGRSQAESRTVEARGVTWRLTWPRASPEREAGAAIWQRMVGGDAPAEIAADLGVNAAEMHRRLQDLILSDSLLIDAVPRNARLEDELRSFVGEELGARLQHVVVASLSHIAWPLVRYVLLGPLAREFFRAEVGDGNSVGLCGGFAVSRLVHALQRGDVPGGISVFPIAVTPVLEKAGVSANSAVSALAYRHFDYGVQASELSFVFEDVRGHQLSRPLRIAKQILDDAAEVDFVFMGVGSPETGALAKAISELQRDYQSLAGVNPEGIERNGQAVGDVLYHLVDAMGAPLPGFKEYNEQLVCSIGLAGLRRLVDGGKRVVVIASGAEKAAVTRAAILGGYVNVLIVDDGLATRLLAGAAPPAGRTGGRTVERAGR